MPNTVNRFYSVPNTGDLPGAWGTSALNPNFNSIDGTLGGFATISLSSATTITLTVPAGAATGLTPGAGPTQSENALLKFSGTLTGNSTIKFTMPGRYIVHNACGSAGSFYIQLSPTSGTGTSVGAPPGRKCQIFFDGTDVDYMDMPEVGAALDLHCNTTGYPPWMNACTVKPYLIKDGTVYSASAYTALAQVLGSTFGGNGSSTFGVPDERARARVAVDVASAVTGTLAGRLTLAGSGVTGTTMGAAGGSEFMQTHSHTTSLSDPGHDHAVTQNAIKAGGNSFDSGPFPAPASQAASITLASSTTGISVSVNGTGSGSSQNVMPVIVSFVPFIKT